MSEIKRHLQQPGKAPCAQRLYAVTSVDQPEHPLHAHYRVINERLRQVGTVPGMLTVEDVHRVTALVLLETWLVGMERIDRMGIDACENLLVWQIEEEGAAPQCVTIDVMQALSYSVSETTLALQEAMEAWPLSARQRRYLHEQQEQQRR